MSSYSSSMDRVALVTGATQGLGLGLVEVLSARLDEGDIVYLTGRDPSRLGAARASLAPTRARVLTELIDVASDESVVEAAARLTERHGSLQIVISNAYSRVLPEDRPAEVIGGYVETNNLGTTRVLRAFAPIVGDGGTVLVVASTRSSSCAGFSEANSVPPCGRPRRPVRPSSSSWRPKQWSPTSTASCGRSARPPGCRP